MRFVRPVLLAAIALLLAGGCSAVGTTSLRNGRPAYNDAIVASNNEQILAMIVRMRYQEPAGLLAVASVTANVRVQASVGTEAGFGPESNFSGNLVPLRAGALYEENPTISYVPVQGPQYLRQMLSPLPLDLVVLLLSAVGETPSTMSLLVREANDLRNPIFLGAEGGENRRFEELAGLLAAMQRRGAVVWAEDETADSPFMLVLRGAGEAHAAEVLRLHALLGLDPPAEPEGIVVLDIRMGIGAVAASEIELRTRSAFDLLKIAAASMEIPDEHLASGRAAPLPPIGPIGSLMRIRCSRSRPAHALVAVEHDGWWHWIDANDGASKQAFRIIEVVSMARIADTVSARSAQPVLTVPVSR